MSLSRRAPPETFLVKLAWFNSIRPLSFDTLNQPKGTAVCLDKKVVTASPAGTKQEIVFVARWLVTAKSGSSAP